MINYLKTNLGDLRYYHESGKDRKRVLMLHGYGASLEFALSFINDSKRINHGNYYLTTLDLPGFGKSTYKNELTFELIYQSVEKLINHLELDDIIIISHSMGAEPALRLNQNEKIKSTILVSPVNYNAPLNNHITVLKNKLIPRTYQKIIEKLNLMHNKNDDFSQKNIDPNLIPFVEQTKTYFDFNKNILYKGLISKEYCENVLFSLYKKAKNIFMISGDRDKFIPYKHLEFIAKDLNVPLKIIKNSDHFLIFKKPEIIKKELKKIIDENKWLSLKYSKRFHS